MYIQIISSGQVLSVYITLNKSIITFSFKKSMIIFITIQQTIFCLQTENAVSPSRISTHALTSLPFLILTNGEWDLIQNPLKRVGCHQINHSLCCPPIFTSSPTNICSPPNSMTIKINHPKIDFHCYVKNQICYKTLYLTGL